ncbi:2,3-diketo-5-methylthio-1-phosphopentane phosphatase [Ancylostoma caninum]|uniref:Enolase-phosphatase E1 n=1 Tax=Ancylostoma caninum TaxID=29170 RepID=A0A368FDI4_ANCCA|nr:2,3-diketo-5-methylthio-1-phosphopentane phosphatase [Ancylostoma caninum]
MPEFSNLLLDIESTVTSISFVKDILFPCAYEAVEDYVREHFDDAPVAKIIGDLRQVSEEESKVDSNIRSVRENKDDCIEDITHNVRHWINIDKKITPMKALQGLIWEEAYRKGEVKGHVYPDVLPALQALSLPTYIYSSGSVLAQKMLFGHSTAGDLTKVLSGYFDTNVGLKGDSNSYTKICEQINVKPSDVLFLTDVEAEARAARAAGLQTMLVVRDGNAPLSDEAKREFPTIRSLDELHNF